MSTRRSCYGRPFTLKVEVALGGKPVSTRPVEDKDAPIVRKIFKDYAPGFLHVDIKHLPQMAGATARCCLFVAIDRAARWVHVHIYADQSEASSTDFLRRL